MPVLLWLALFITALLLVLVVAILCVMMKDHWDLSNVAIFFIVLFITLIGLAGYCIFWYYERPPIKYDYDFNSWDD